MAKQIGVGAFEPVRIAVDGRVTRAVVAAELTEANVGQLAHVPVVLAPLAYAQRLTGMKNSITRIFVQAETGQEGRVRDELRRLAAGQANVEPASFDTQLFSEAAAPVNQSTATFALICALVGFAFAFCSMLLSIDLRRRLVRELRCAGITRAGMVKTLLFDALMLGTIAAAAGLALGDALSLLVFGTNPGYLTFAFPVGAQRIVTWQSATISVAVAMLAACVGVLMPLRDIWTPVAGKASSSHGAGVSERVLLAVGLVFLMATTLIWILAPQSAVVGVVVLMGALVCLLPALSRVLMWAFDRVQRRIGRPGAEIAVAELRASGARVRAVAIAAVGAIAVFSTVTIQGSHMNLQRSLNGLVRQLSDVADIWVMAPGQQNTLATMPFRDAAGARIARLPGVRKVGLYHAGFLEYGARRIWVLAPPPSPRAIPPGQLVEGNLADAALRLRAGGWALVSQALAAAHHLRIGQTFVLPSAHPLTLRVAGLITNLGWPPGAMILNSADYVRGWGSADPTAYTVTLSAGASASRVADEIRAALGHSPAFMVQTERQRESSQVAISRQGLGRLTQIAALVLLAGLLAIVAAMGAVIWQRRRRFARLKIQGVDTMSLWAALIWESLLLLVCGCLAGAVFGVYGQLLLSHALRTVTGFPVISSLALPLAAASFALVTAIAAAMIAIPGYRAASVRAHHPASPAAR